MRGLKTMGVGGVYFPSVPFKVKFAATQQCWHWLRWLVTVGISCQRAKALLAHMARCRCAIYDRKRVVVINHMGERKRERGEAGKVITVCGARTCGDALCFFPLYHSCEKSKLAGETRDISVLTSVPTTKNNTHAHTHTVPSRARICCTERRRDTLRGKLPTMLTRGCGITLIIIISPVPSTARGCCCCCCWGETC